MEQDISSMALQNVGTLPHHYTMSLPRRLTGIELVTLNDS